MKLGERNDVLEKKGQKIIANFNVVWFNGNIATVFRCKIAIILAKWDAPSGRVCR